MVGEGPLKCLLPWLMEYRSSSSNSSSNTLSPWLKQYLVVGAFCHMLIRRQWLTVEVVFFFRPFVSSQTWLLRRQRCRRKLEPGKRYGSSNSLLVIRVGT